jgi:hypothetical protein
MVGAVLSYARGLHGTGSGLQISGMITMLVGTVCLAAVLARTVTGLRRRGRPATSEPAQRRPYGSAGHEGSHIPQNTRERTTARAEPRGTR